MIFGGFNQFGNGYARSRVDIACWQGMPEEPRWHWLSSLLLFLSDYTQSTRTQVSPLLPPINPDLFRELRLPFTPERR